jgi:hypothetical protein
MRFEAGAKLNRDSLNPRATPILLYGQSHDPDQASAGASAANAVRRLQLAPASAAWDFLSIALAVVTADGAVKRKLSPDGWTRELEVQVAVSDPDVWTPLAPALSAALAFLTTDIWTVGFVGGATPPAPPKVAHAPECDSVVLLSGGLDSLVGAIDLAAQGHKLLAVSHTVRGDREKQVQFSRTVGAEPHLQLNHNANTPRADKETSQRSRSLIFLAFSVLAATATQRYADGEIVPIYICENGFIAINPPLTGSRLGSLSTRTAHPHFLGEVHKLLSDVGLRIEFINPYAETTKGEMLANCLDRHLLMQHASTSTSCGRYQRYNYTHCGRCIPCQIRRAAFLRAGWDDATPYFYPDLGKLHGPDLDDVRSAGMARLAVQEGGLHRWLGSALSSPHIPNRAALQAMLQRGLDELGALHSLHGVS